MLRGTPIITRDDQGKIKSKTNKISKSSEDASPNYERIIEYQTKYAIHVLYPIIRDLALNRQNPDTPHELLTSPILSGDKKALFSKAFNGFLQGDVVLAPHILVVLVEEMLRKVLYLNGFISTDLNEKEIQEHYTLNNLLHQHEKELVTALGGDSNLVFNLKALLIKEPSNIRNKILHGLYPYSLHPSAIYLWWIINRLCFKANEIYNDQRAKSHDNISLPNIFDTRYALESGEAEILGQIVSEQNAIIALDKMSYSISKPESELIHEAFLEISQLPYSSVQIKHYLDQFDFIPEDRKDYWAYAIIGGLEGNGVKMVHFLVPQIEAALRSALNKRNIITSKMPDSGIQHEHVLDELFDEHRVELINIFGEDLITIAEDLLVNPNSNNYRNRFAHSLLAISDFYSAEASTLLWLGLRLCHLFRTDP